MAGAPRLEASIRTSEDPERRLSAAVQVLCAITIVWAALAVAVAHVRGVLEPHLVVGNAGWIVAAFCSIALLRSGRYVPGVRVAVWGLVALFAIYLGRGAVHGAPYIRLFPLPLVLSALLLGRRELWTVLAALAGVLGLGLARDGRLLGGTGPVPPLDPPFGIAGSALITLVALSIMLERFGAVMRSSAESARRGEAQARSMNERLRAMYETTPDSVAVTTPEGTFLEVNPAFTRLTGHAAEDALGKTAADLALWADAERGASVLQRQARGLPIDNEEATFRREDGTAFVGLLSARPITIDGRRCWLTVTRDVSELRRAEAERGELSSQLRQAQRLESVARLAGGVAHDFNNIVTVLLSCARSLRESLRGDQALDEEDLDDIEYAAARARDLTRQLLLFARRQIVAPVALDVNEVVRGSERLLRRVLGEDIDLTLSLAACLPPVSFDRGELEQVLMNLAVNARDAMPGAGRLTIATARVDVPRTGDLQPRSWVRLNVTDSGVGMDAHVKEHIFEPFFTTKPVGKGTGLGLATVRAIVVDRGGTIRVESEPGHGATFELLVPATAEVPRAAGVAAAGSPAGGHEIILLVEDDDAVRAVTARGLRSSGYVVREAPTPVAALEVAAGEAGRVDLLITDVVLPVMSGPALAEEVVRRWPDVRTLFVSGYVPGADDRVKISADTAHFLMKPFTTAELVEKVRALLDGQEAGRRI